MLERWRERDVFHESIRRREGSPPFVFYEGPPTANGRPGSHHVLARVFKDVFPRYQTMRGHLVHRKAGWDCHGLPVELEIEKELGFHNKDDIERYGVAEFNAKCRESVLRYIDEWNELTERIGFWIDTDDAYFTLDNDYIESVWWSLKQVWEKGLLYEGHKVVPVLPALRHGALLPRGRARATRTWSTRPSTCASRCVDEPASRCSPGPPRRGRCVPHAALAVDPDVDVRARPHGRRDADPRRGARGARARRGCRDRRPHARARSCSGCATSRRSPTSPTTASAATPCCRATSSRSRTAPASCTPAPPSARTTSGSPTENGLTIHNPVRPDGTFDERTGPVRRDARARGRPRHRRGARASPAGCSAPRSTSTPTRTAGAATRRSSTTPRRAGTCAPRR